MLQIVKFNQKEGQEYQSNGLIHVNPNKPEYGSLMLIKRSMSVNNGGFANKRVLTGFITGQVEDLKDIITGFSIKHNDDFNEKLGSSYDIIEDEKVEADLTNDDLGYQVKINPQTGKALVTEDNQLIYRRTFVVDEKEERKSVKVTHADEVEYESNMKAPEFEEQTNSVK